MMDKLWLYDGGLDRARRVLTLETEGSAFVDPARTAKYRDVIELISDSHQTLTSQALDEDGAWHTFMVVHCHRKEW
jgi:hypothetical protein